jgi:proteasome lid subunit RPN8/RPN11
MSRPLLELESTLYSLLISDLAASGAGVKEAGAFLLGDCGDSRCRRVKSYLMYDVIAPGSSRAHDYVALTGEEMAAAWNYCYRAGLQVVADVHTHPGWPTQSHSDRANPIVSVPGHVALIVPFYALSEPKPRDLGVHLFMGEGLWRSMFDCEAEGALRLTQRR